MLITASQLIPGDGGAALANAGVVIENGKIAAVGAAAELAAAYPEQEQRAFPDCTLLPGLIDMHTHLGYWYDLPDAGDYDDYLVAELAAWRAGKALRQGVTAVRDVYSPDGLCAQLQRGRDKGLLAAPKLFWCNSALTITGGIDWKCAKGTVQVDGTDECVKAVRAQARAGATWIKVMDSWRTPGVAHFTQAELNAIVTEAHRLGLRACAHATMEPAQQMCIDAGFDSIEHGTELTVEQAAHMAARNMAWAPTVYVYRQVLDDILAPVDNDPSRLSGRKAQTYRLYTESLATYKKRLPQLAATGVTIIAGTDTVLSYEPVCPAAREVQTLAACGLPPMQAIMAATGNAAKVLGQEGRLGVLAVEAAADLLLVAGDPLADLTALEQVRGVWQDGEPVRL